jgi:hypothetical protein
MGSGCALGRWHLYRRRGFGGWGCNRRECLSFQNGGGEEWVPAQCPILLVRGQGWGCEARTCTSAEAGSGAGAGTGAKCDVLNLGGRGRMRAPGGTFLFLNGGV